MALEGQSPSIRAPAVIGLEGPRVRLRPGVTPAGNSVRSGPHPNYVVSGHVWTPERGTGSCLTHLQNSLTGDWRSASWSPMWVTVLELAQALR